MSFRARVFGVSLFVLLLFSLQIRGEDPAFQYFLSILNRIEGESLFKIDEQEWLGKSLNILLPGHDFHFVSLNQYTRILQSDLARRSVSEKNLFLTRAVGSLLAALPDPYADFLSPGELKEESEQHGGTSFTGFGIQLSERSGVVQIAGILPGSTAEKAGLLPGDRLAAVNAKKISGLRDAFEKLSVKNQARVSVSVERKGQLSTIRLSPGPVHLTPFYARQFGSTGYVSMQVVLPGSEKKFLEAAQDLQEKGIRLLVLDLRDCIGGDVDSARQIAGFFLKPGDLVYIKETRSTRIPYLNRVTPHLSVPLVLLVDGATASACELAAGALKDHHAGSLYGTNTLGKGYIETTWMLPGGWALRLTTARYLSPSGKEVQNTGIFPDVECEKNSPAFFCRKGEYGAELETLFHDLKK